METTEKTPIFGKPWLPFAWIIAASALAHLWCLGSVFFLDDSVQIEHNERLVTGEFWGAGLTAWTQLVYAVEYRLFGISSPGFHAVNWLLHTAVACVLFAFGRDFLGDRARWRVALFGAVLFAVHPLGSEIPNYARTQDLAWVTLFSLLAAWAMLGFLKNGGWMKLLACAVCVFGATFSKGPGLFHAALAVSVVGLAVVTSDHWKMFRRHVWLLAASAVVILAALWLSGGLGAFLNGLKSFGQPRFIGNAYTLGRVFWEFAWRSVVPVSLSADHHIAETIVHPGMHFWNVPDTGATWATAGFVAFTAFSGFLAWRRSTRLFGVCFLLFCSTILFRVLYPIPEFMPEYRIYPGLPWFCLGAAILLHAALRKFTEIPPRVPAVIVVAVFIFLSAKRSFLWHDLDRLSGDVLRQYPTQSRALWELDERDVDAGKWQEIITRQRTAWPEVFRRFMEENQRLAPARELPTGHFALAETACRGSYALALAHTEGADAGFREINQQEIYMKRLGLDPLAHSLHWGYFYYNKAMVMETAGMHEAAIALLERDEVPRIGKLALKRLKEKAAAR
ncbi:MAG: hypothetical protein ABIT37_22500 [Luteolibacter sp.]